jgi:hypothetical protein
VAGSLIGGAERAIFPLPESSRANIL